MVYYVQVVLVLVFVNYVTQVILFLVPRNHEEYKKFEILWLPNSVLNHITWILSEYIFYLQAVEMFAINFLISSQQPNEVALIYFQHNHPEFQKSDSYLMKFMKGEKRIKFWYKIIAAPIVAFRVYILVIKFVDIYLERQMSLKNT
jgi:hypothetical protein